MSYRKPTLIETYAEVHLLPGSFGPDVFFEVVPHLKASGFSEVELGQVSGLSMNPNPEAPSYLEINAPRVRCWNPSKTELIQLSPDFLAANLVGSYPGWKRFREVFRVASNSLEAALKSTRLASFSLCTIDLIKVPRKGFRLGRYIECGGAFVPASFSDVAVAFDITLGRGFLHTDAFNRQVILRGRPNSDEFFEVRIEAKFHDRVHEAEPDVTGLLERLHEESNLTFEGLVTDFTRDEVMEGTVSHATNV